MKQFQENVG